MSYKFLSHTADVKILAEGRDAESAFTSSAMALKEMIVGKIKIKGRIKRTVSVEGKDFGGLLYNFLEEFLFLLDAENFVLSRIRKIKIEEKKDKLHLETEVFGDKASNYDFTNEVKAITYNDMFVGEKKGKGKKEKKFICRFVLDV